jgi:hypothetical protein
VINVMERINMGQLEIHSKLNTVYRLLENQRRLDSLSNLTNPIWREGHYCTSYPMKWDFPPGEFSSKEVNYD